MIGNDDDGHLKCRCCNEDTDIKYITYNDDGDNLYICNQCYHVEENYVSWMEKVSWWDGYEDPPLIHADEVTAEDVEAILEKIVDGENNND